MQLLLCSVCAIFISAGYHFVVSCLLFCATYSFIWLQEATDYSNVRVMLSLFTFCLSFSGFHKVFSLDLLRSHPTNKNRKTADREVEIQIEFVWWLLRMLLIIVYVHAGIAKLGEDWLVRGEPLTHWLQNREANKPFAKLLLQMSQHAGFAMSAGGVMFELSFIVLALPQKTVPPLIRSSLIGSSFLFHFMNKNIFGLGMLPYLFWLTNTTFFPVDWLSRLFLGASTPGKKKPSHPANATLRYFSYAFLILMALFPLRFLLYTNDPNWTRYCSEFSWRFRVNDYRGGLDTLFFLEDKYGNHTIEPAVLVDAAQQGRLLCNPVLLHQMAFQLAEKFSRATGEPVTGVFAHAVCSLNYAAPLPMINPRFNLLTTPLWSYPLPFVTTR